MGDKARKYTWQEDYGLLKKIDEMIKNNPFQKSDKELDSAVVQFVMEEKGLKEGSARQEANQYFAYPHAPQDVKDNVEQFSFSKIAKVSLKVCRKIDYKPECLFHEYLSEGIAHAIIRQAVKVSNSTRAAACAGEIRDALKSGNLASDSNGELMPTKEGWQVLLNIPSESTVALETFQAAIGAVIDKRLSQTIEGFKIQVNLSFQENLENLIKQKLTGKKKGNANRKKILEIMSHVDCATPTEALVLQFDLKNRGVDERVAEQFKILAYREYRLSKGRKRIERNNNAQAQLRKMDGKPSDKQVISKDRLEQALLRNILLDGKGSGKCAVCHKEYEASSLVAAHKKRRVDCSPDERYDPDVVMLLCKFGCDHLYEEGFILIDAQGKVVENPSKMPSCNETAFIEALVTSNRQLNERRLQGKSSEYFAWHNKKHTANTPDQNNKDDTTTAPPIE